MFLLLAGPDPFVTAAPQAPAPAKADASTAIAPGVTYKHLTRKTVAGEPWSIHVLEVSPKEKTVRIQSVKAQPGDNGMQRELPTAMASRAAAGGANVVAVVNGDYDMAGDYLGVSDGLTVTSDRKSTRLNSSHIQKSRMPSSA